MHGRIAGKLVGRGLQLANGAGSEQGKCSVGVIQGAECGLQGLTRREPSRPDLRSGHDSGGLAGLEIGADMIDAGKGEQGTEFSPDTGSDEAKPKERYDRSQPTEPGRASELIGDEIDGGQGTEA